MASPFDDFDRLLSNELIGAFGEVAIIRPRSSSDYEKRDFDTDRREVSVRGIFSAGPSEQKIRGRAIGSEFSGVTRLASMAAEFWISASDATGLGSVIAKGDGLELADRPGTSGYTVTSIQHTDMGDIALILAIEDNSK